jgi:hypothetical protein
LKENNFTKRKNYIKLEAQELNGRLSIAFFGPK